MRNLKMEREQETEFVCVVVFLCVSVCVRVPYGFCAGSSLIICIFSFELLFAALHAAQAPEGLPTNSVKRQVRHKLIMGCLRVIALLSHNHVWVCGTKKYRNTWRLSHTQKQEERATTHTHHWDSDWIWKETKVEWGSFWVHQTVLPSWMERSNF